MATWFSMSLGDGMISGTLAAEIEKRFNSTFNDVSRPPEIAVFTRPESEGRLYCEIIAYFSPAAQEVARAFDADPCQKPARPGLTLLAGEEAAWSVLFPEEG